MKHPRFNIKGTISSRSACGAKVPRFFSRLRNWGISHKKLVDTDFATNGAVISEEMEKIYLGEVKRTGLFGRSKQKGRFFSPERIKERHDFRIKVSVNRKWIMIGSAIVVMCTTFIYLSITYGSALTALLRILNR